MFEKEDNPIEKARKSVEFFGSRSQNKMHARHISSTTAKNQGLNIFDIEKNQELQDSILNIHHILNIILEESLVVKIIQNSIGTSKLKVFKKE